MTEIVFRSNGAMKTAISASGMEPDRIRGLASTALYGGDVFEMFGQAGDSISVEESRGGVIGLSPGGLLVKLCTGSYPALDDPTVTERATLYHASGMDALAELMEAADCGQEVLHRRVLEDLGIRELPGPAEERTEYWVTLVGSAAIVQEQFITNEGGDRYEN